MNPAWLRPNCRICGSEVRSVLNLGETPLANELLGTKEELVTQHRYPLDFCFCDACKLGQLSVAVPGDILYSRYLYETPKSSSLETHYERVRQILESFGALGPKSVVMEMGSNNGALLKFLKPHAGEVLGIEPAENVAMMAERDGIKTVVKFFGLPVADDVVRYAGRADVFIARHCLAHVDNLREIVQAAARVLDEDGILYIENAYLLDTLQGVEWDQIYHEHHSYLSVTALEKLFLGCGLRIVRVDRSEVHGGSFMVFARPIPRAHFAVQPSVNKALTYERSLFSNGVIDRFREAAGKSQGILRDTLSKLLAKGSTICALGATAKGNTLFNVCGITSVEIPYCFDSTLMKQGRYLPGSGILVVSEDLEARENVLLLTAWNYEVELRKKYARFLERGGQFLVPIPMARMVKLGDG